MPGFRQMKTKLLAVLNKPGWQQSLQREIEASERPVEYVGPFLSFLLREDVRRQATWGLALAVRTVAAEDKEAARTIMRRLMWSMNEESGNIGWGIPEAMGAILAKTPFLAEEYWRILFSYVRETDGDDNFIDHEPLRRGAYWGIAHLAAHAPRFSSAAFARLVPGLEEPSPTARAVVAWGITRLLEAREHAAPLPPLGGEAVAKARELLNAMLRQPDEPVSFFGEDALVENGLHSLARQALEALSRE